MDVGEDSTGSDGDSAKKLVELLVVLDSKGDVPGDNPGLLVVAGGVSGELEDLSGEVLEDGGEVDTSSDSDAANTGALFFGGWTVLIFLAKNAGTVSGQFVVPIMAWNALMTAYCVKEGM